MIWENISLAISSLRSNKMRTLLTMLGIIIGIMSIIAIVIIGDAMTATVSDTLSTLGTSNITVSVQEKSEPVNEMAAMMGGRMRVSSSSGKSPTSEDLISDRMIEEVKSTFANDVVGVSLSYSAGSAKAKDGNLYANVSITGTNETYIKANNITMLSGRFISEDDVKSKSQAAIVSDRFVKSMFPDGSDPTGQQVKIYKTNSIEIYTIVGVYEYEQNGFEGLMASNEDISTTFYIPITTAKKDLLEKNYYNITVVGKDNVDVVELTARLQRYFDNVYINNKTWKASASNLTSMLDTVASTMSTISIAIAFIAGISLLVGGIGVMNIMLVSVTERTREIGTRKALGAKNFHIQFQFVTEAILVSSIGGVIGLLLGIAIGAAISVFFEVPFVVSPFVTIGSVLFSMAIGVFFGLYPANKAAKLDPIEALRYE